MKRVINIRQNTGGLLQGVGYAAWFFLVAALYFRLFHAILASAALLVVLLVLKVARSKRKGERFDCLDMLYLLLGAVAFWVWVVLYNWLG